MLGEIQDTCLDTEPLQPLRGTVGAVSWACFPPPEAQEGWVEEEDLSPHPEEADGAIQRTRTLQRSAVSWRGPQAEGQWGRRFWVGQDSEESPFPKGGSDFGSGTTGRVEKVHPRARSLVKILELPMNMGKGQGLYSVILQAPGEE